MSELKPCAFCGAPAEYEYDPDLTICPHMIYCTGNCSESPTIDAETEEEAFGRWNRRPLEEALEARVKELEAELAQAKAREQKRDEQFERQRYENMDLLVELKREIALHKADTERDKEQYGLMMEEILKIPALHTELAQARAAAVQWVTYTGEPETLPERGRLVLVHDGVANLSTWHTEDMVWDFDDRAAVRVKIGDRWAYLPEPEGKP